MRLYRLLLTLFFILIFSYRVQALEVVYPKKETTTINAKSSFLIGNIGQDKTLTINEIPVTTYKDGVFVYVIPLEYGENIFEIKSSSEDGTESTLTYKINRPFPLKASSNTVKPILTEEFETIRQAKIQQNNSPLRTEANDNSKRITHLDKDTVLYLDAERGQYYRVFLNNRTKYWIKKKFVKIQEDFNGFQAFNIEKVKRKRNRQYDYYYFKTNDIIPYIVEERNNQLTIKFLYINNFPKKLSKYTENIQSNRNILSFDIKNKNIGYKVFYENNYMVLRTTKPIKLHKKHPLKGIKIAIDAGHGGTEAGAIGPTKVREADVALDISKRVEKLLLEEQAKPFMTRNSNVNVGLYERVEKINEFDPVFSISIHANALPDGADPYKKYGTAVYYYTPQAKNFADTIKQSITKAVETRDDGTISASFVLTRMTSPMAILVETAYMINPFDYEKLLDENFRQQTAQAIVDGIKKHLSGENK